MTENVKRPSQLFSERIREARERRRWSQQDLALRLAEMGSPTDRATVARTETGARGISLDDALMLAAALDVSPVRLLLPTSQEDYVALAAGFKVAAYHVEPWLLGLTPLPVFVNSDAPGLLTDEQLEDANRHVVTPDGKLLSREENEARYRFWQQELPARRSAAFSEPGVWNLVARAEEYADAAGSLAESRALPIESRRILLPAQRRAMRRKLDQLAAEVERQRAELDREDAEDGSEG